MLHSFAASSKIGHDFDNKVVLKLKLQNTVLAENVFLHPYCSLKKNQEGLDDF